MTYSYRSGCTITFVRDDGQPGPGESKTFNMVDQYKVSVQDEGCVEVMFYGKPAVTHVYPWWRIWELKA